MTFVSKCRMLLVVAGVGVMLFGQRLPAQQFSSSSDGGAAGGSAVAGSPIAGQAMSTAVTPFERATNRLPFEYGGIVQGGVGLTEDRDSFRFLMAGVHAGKVLARRDKSGFFKGNFEYAAELFPFWQSYTPKFQRANCYPSGIDDVTCGPNYTVGGTFTGVTLTPIILRYNFARSRRFVPWAQAAGGLLWTNHKYPAFGTPVNSASAALYDGPNTDTSVWNFTPQGGIGLHYFISPRRSIDFGANAVHISSASLGDKNPGVNASVQFSLGYTFWK